MTNERGDAPDTPARTLPPSLEREQNAHITLELPYL